MSRIEGESGGRVVLSIVACTLVSVGGALASTCDPPPPACPQQITDEELIDNGEFNGTDGFSCWNFWPPNQPQRFAIDPNGGDPIATIDDSAYDCGGPPQDWCVRISQEDGRLRGLKPGTIYTLKFRAKADVGTPPIKPEIYMKPHSAPQTGTYYPVWWEIVTLDQTLRDYVFEFRTPDDLPQDFCTDPLDRLIRIDFGVGRAGTKVWIDKVSLKASKVLTLGSDDLRLSSFEADEEWRESETGGASTARDTQNVTDGALSMKLTVPPDGGAFVARNVPINLGGAQQLWDMTLSVCTDHPERIGRMYVIARTGVGTLYSWRSFGGLLTACSTVVLRKEEFFQPLGAVGVDWSNVSTLGIKVDSNSNGAGAPAPDTGAVNVWVDDVVVHPKTTVDGSDVDSIRPPLMMDVRALAPTSDGITVVWTTDVMAKGFLQCGTTPGTGSVVSEADPSLDHQLSLTGLAAGTTYHCQAISEGSLQNSKASASRVSGAKQPFVPLAPESASGDFTVDTEPSTPWVPPDPSAFFPIGIGEVIQPLDEQLAADAGFNAIHTYLCGSDFPNNSNLCFPGMDYQQASGQYFSVASGLGLKVIVQPVATEFKRDWSNCYCSDYGGFAPVCYNRQWSDPPCPTRSPGQDGCPANAGRCGGGYCTSLLPSDCCLGLNVDPRIAWFSDPANTGRNALLGYYLADEPECALNDNPDRMFSIYQRIKADDSFHPVFGGTTSVKDNPYSTSWDVGMQDSYPIPGPVSGVIPALASAQTTTKPFHFLYQAYSYETDTNWPLDRASRFPSWEEMRTMSYLGIIYGARGTWAWAESQITRVPGTAWVFGGLSRLAREMRRIEPVLASSNPGICARLDGTSSVAFLRKSYGGKQYLIAAETQGHAATSAHFTLGAGATGAAKVLEIANPPTSPIPIIGGGFTANFGPYETHVYEIPIDPAVGTAAPGPVSGTIQGTNDVLVSWVDNSCDATGFRVERKGGPNADFTFVTTTPAGVTSFVDHPPLDFASYTYRIGAIAGATVSYGPETQPVVVVSPAPSAPTVAGTTPSSVTLTWNDPSNNEDGFLLQRSRSLATGYTDLATVSSPPYTDTTYDDGVTSYYRVRAYRTGIGNSPWSAALTNPMPLRPPANLTATVTTGNIVQLNWVNSSTAEDNYKVERRQLPTGVYALFTTTPANTTTAQGQNDTNTYAFRAYTYKAGMVNSAYSNEVSSPAVAPSKPNPANNAVNIAKSNLKLSWTKGIRAATFEVWLGTNPDPSTWTARCSGPNLTSCTILTLPGSTLHYWRVDTYNSAGLRTPGPTWTFTTKP